MIGIKGERAEEPLFTFKSIIMALIFLIIIGIVIGSIVPEWTKSKQTQGSAFLLGEAINDVYLQAEDFGKIDYNKTVNINIPYEKRASVSWVIYSGVNPDEETGSFISERPGYCDGVCYGFFEREDLPEYELIEPDAVQDFVLQHECKADVEVYYDNGEVKLRFIEETVEGHCCSEDRLFSHIGSGAKTNTCKFQED